ncbi:MAG: DUF6249 domain-containing protein [Bacteroides sp.]
MKRFILSLLLVVGLLLPSQATLRTTVVRDSQNHVVRIYEVNDTVVNGRTQTDTLTITTLPDGTQTISRDSHYEDHSNWGIKKGEIALFSIFCVFFGPVLIIFLIFYFRYKNRKAAYRVAEQAIAAGRPLPEDFIQEAKRKPGSNSLSQGINSICIGIGLFIFLWALTHEFGLGCIGLLIMFMGFGKVILYYLQQGNPINPGKEVPPTTASQDHNNQIIPTE